ncbi:MAG: DUF4149 domain-containing protein [Planctomycetaceae bacterium]
MPARLLAPLARVALALWMGAIASVAALVAPRAFRLLAASPRAGEFLAPIFQGVDRFGIAAACLGLLAQVAAPRAPGRVARAALLGAMGAAAALNAYALAPRIAVRAEPIALLHGLSAGLWMLLFCCGITLLAAGASPRSDARQAP